MKITDSTISMSGSSFYAAQYEKKESLKMWIGSRRPNFEGSNNNRPLLAPPLITPLNDTVSLSDNSKICPSKCDDPFDGANLSDEDKIKILMIQEMVRALTGKNIKIKIPKINTGSSEAPQNTDIKQPQQQQSPQSQGRQGWGVEYDYHESYHEVEAMSFKAQGAVKTADGKEISFNLELSMQRQYFTEKNISVRAGDAVKIDPLVINFENNTVQLTDKKYEFDLNSDGKTDKISFVQPGSGFLALDLNGDGVVNNGTELFGPKTGNGFAELAKYDEDKNGWIDESDSVFSRLLLWSKDASGKDILSSLAEKNIGAIYLNNIDALFHLKNSDNKENGEIKSSGVFLKENATAGSIMQVDLTA
jgi:hypothetical protein